MYKAKIVSKIMCYVKMSVTHVFSLFQVIRLVLNGLYISQHACVYRSQHFGRTQT